MSIATLLLAAVLATSSAESAAAVSQVADPGAELRAAASLGDLESVTALLDGGDVDVDAANEFAVGFMADFNRRFARPALNAHDAHRPLRDDEHLQEVFTWQEKRKVSKSLTLHYKRVMYLLEPTAEAHDVKGKRVRVYEDDAVGECGDLLWAYDALQLSASGLGLEGGEIEASLLIPLDHPLDR